MEPPFWEVEGEVVWGSVMVSYWLSIVTVALSVTIQPQFAIECLRRNDVQINGGGVTVPKFRGVPLGVDPRC